MASENPQLALWRSEFGRAYTDRNDRERLEMKKYCNNDRRHTVHKETR